MLFRYPFASSWCSSLWPQYIVKGVIIFTKYFYDFTTFKARARGHPDSFFLVLRIFSSTKKKEFKWILFQFLICFLHVDKKSIWYLFWISIKRMPVKCFFILISANFEKEKRSELAQCSYNNTKQKFQMLFEQNIASNVTRNVP